MSLAPGRMLAHYRLVEQIGAGGMGVVWKALDTTLDREVAVKVLPEALAGETERLARFEREAKLLASLNHASIAAVYGLHESGGTRFIAMELVPGEDLKARLEAGPLPVDEALVAARRIAQALEAAHESGVIDRDLKPANIVLTPDGSVKVLDFGLAKAFAPETASGSASASLSPTVTSAGSVAGMILGTAAYMSPEQARGKFVDRRADVWAFGCVLYELLAGRPAFPGETVTDILARVVQGEPDWTALPGDVPPRVRALLERCLRKDLSRRLRDAGDARVEVEDALAGEPEPHGVAGRPEAALWLRALPWAVAALLAVALAVTGLPRDAAPPPMIRFTVDLPGDRRTQEISMSPDGLHLATIGLSRSGSTELWLRPIDTPEAHAVPGTEGASFPFWSPDGESIGFFLQSKLKRVDVASETTRTIADAPNGRGAAWNADDEIVFAPEGRDVLYIVSASGGTPTPVTTLNTERGDTSHRFPHFLPDGRRFTYFALEGDDPDGRVYVGSLDSDEQVPLFEGRSEAYVASDRLFHVQEGTLVAQAFNAGSLELSPEVVPVAQDIFTSEPVWARAAFSVSRSGAVAYRSRRIQDDRLVWFDRAGRQVGSIGEPGEYFEPALSPDSRRLVFLRKNPGSEAIQDIWQLDTTRGTLSQVGAISEGELPAAWSPDGKGLVYALDRALVWHRLGSAEAPETLLPAAPTDDPSLPSVPGRVRMFPDGTHLVFENWSSQTDWDLWVLPLEGEAMPSRLVTAPKTQSRARASADGRWIAYDSNESGQTEVYVQEFPAGGKWVLSSGGGSAPAWRRDGRELFYLSGDAKLVSVAVTTDGGFEAGSPTELFGVPVDGLTGFAVTPDGERFLLNVPVDPDRAPTLTVLLNWEGEPR